MSDYNLENVNNIEERSDINNNNDNVYYIEI